MDKKKQKGSITLFVLISVLFFIIIAIAIYTQISNKTIAQERELDNIKEKYEVTDEDLEQEYEEEISKEENRIAITLYEKTENTMEPKVYYQENRWYNINDNDFVLDVVFSNKEDKKANKVTVTNDAGVSVTKTQEEIERDGAFIITENCTIIAESTDAKKRFVVSKIDRELPQVSFTSDQPQTIMIAKNTMTTINGASFTVTDKISKVNTVKYGFVTSNVEGTVPEDYVTVKGTEITPLEKQVGIGTYYLWVQVEDIAGNVTTVYSQPITVMQDNIPPTKPVIEVSGNEDWINQNVTVTISGSTDNIELKEYEISLDDGKTWEKIDGDKITFTENINQEVWFRAVDTSDNVSEVVKQWVRIDKTLPIIVASPGSGSVAKTRDVTITVTDEGESGLAENTIYQYQLGTSNTTVPTGTWSTYTSGTTFKIGSGLTGTYYLWVREVTDVAGNVSRQNGTKVGNYHVFGSYVFDNQAPSITLGPDGGTYTIPAGQSKVQINTKVTVTDVGGSGANTFEYGWSTSNTASPSSWETSTSGSTITNDLTGGNIYLWVKSTDSAGNTTTKVSNAFIANYQIVYNANGGSGAPSAQIKTYGVTLTLSSTVPTKSGYNFLGWSTSSAATTVNYAPGGSYTKNESATLYAVWEEIRYTLTITNSAGEISTISGRPGETIDLSGYETGSTSNVYYTVYFNGNGVGTPSSSSLSGYATRYKAYTVTSGYGSISGSTYTFGNGNGSVKTSIAENTPNNISLPSISLNSNWTFNGWYTSSSSGSYVGGSGTSINPKTYNGQTLYAHGTYTPPSKTYYLYYNPNGGTGAPSTQSYTTTSSSYTFTISNTEPIKNGYRFLGWDDSSSASSAKYDPGDRITVTGSTTLYAVWEEIKYTLTITNSFGSTYTVSGNPGSTVNLANYETGSTSNVYYTVYFNGNGVGTPSSSSLSGYATRYKSYSLTSGYGSISGSTYTFGNGNGSVRTSIVENTPNSIRLPSISLNANYTFNGWYTSSSSGSYVGGSGTSINPKTYNGQTLYAHGTYTPPSKTYYLYYNANGGSGAPSTQSYTTTSSSYTFRISSSEPTRSGGYTFLGWSTSSSASSPSYYPGGSITVYGSTTLYAVWQEKPNNPPVITITPNSNSTWKKNHTVTVKITDPDGDTISVAKRKWLDVSSGVSSSQLTVNISNPSNESITGAGMTGTYYLWVYAKDSRGAETLTHSGGFKYDGENPSVTGAVSGASGAQTVYLTGTATEPRNQGHDPSGLEDRIYLMWPGLGESDYNTKWFGSDVQEEEFFTSGARKRMVLKHSYGKTNEHRGQRVYLKSKDNAQNESSAKNVTIPK